MSKTFRYQSAGANSMVFADTTDVDHTYRIGVERTWSDSSKSVRYLRYSFRENGSVFHNKANCADACAAIRVNESFSLQVGFPTPYSEPDRVALIARFQEFTNNVIEALKRDGVVGGSLPPASAEYNGTVTV